jgi:hypothetical protein
MPECDFVDLIVNTLEEFMPLFIGIYRHYELIGQPWDSSVLLDHIEKIAGKGNFKVEKAAREQHIAAGETTSSTPATASELLRRQRIQSARVSGGSTLG